MNSSPRRNFSLSYTLNITLSPEDIWPDGDGPEDPTVEDVEQLIEECGGFMKVKNDWFLEQNGNWSFLTYKTHDQSVEQPKTFSR